MHPALPRTPQQLAAEARAAVDAGAMTVHLQLRSLVSGDGRVAAWTDLPDLVTANQGEDGILDLCELLLERQIGIEAGLLSLDDARAFVASGIAPRCVRASRAVARGHGIRTGLEDTPVLPDGRTAKGNGELVAAAAALLAAGG